VKFGGTFHVGHTKTAVPFRAFIPGKRVSITPAAFLPEHLQPAASGNNFDCA
jgi:hypothetical protein